MKGSPIFPRDESAGCDDELEYDLRDDFSKFLEEARKNASHEVEPQLLSSFPVKNKKKPTEAGSDRSSSSRRSWKNSLFFWWRFQKEEGGVVATPQVSKPRLQRAAASGPMPGGRSKQYHVRRRSGRPASGPLSGCFTPARADEEAEVPYMCLQGQQLDDTPGCRNQDFGPIYLVT